MKHKKTKLEKQLVMAANLNALLDHARGEDPDARQFLEGITFKVGQDGRVYYDCPPGRDENKVVQGIRYHTGVAFETKYPAGSPEMAAHPARPYVLDYYDTSAVLALLTEKGVTPHQQVTGQKDHAGKTADAPTYVHSMKF